MHIYTPPPLLPPQSTHIQTLMNVAVIMVVAVRFVPTVLEALSVTAILASGWRVMGSLVQVFI